MSVFHVFKIVLTYYKGSKTANERLSQLKTAYFHQRGFSFRVADIDIT